MQTDVVIILIAISIGFAVLAYLIRRELRRPVQQPDTTLVEWLKSMQITLESTNRSLNDAMRGSSADMTKALQMNSKQLNDRLDTAARVIGDLKQHLGEMSEVGRGIRSLQEFLQSPKLRGNIGEQVLADMIGQTFPKQSFHLQYPFRSGGKVDAVLKTDAGLLCIDAKFPMENFIRMHKSEIENERKVAKKEFISDVKRHVSDISKKYILPEEGTLDFALMYVPSESVYYELTTISEITEYARQIRVYPVSPNTLYAHLQVLLLSFQGKEMEKKSVEVFRLLRGIQKEHGRVDKDLQVLGKHIQNAYASMSSVSSSFQVMGNKLSLTDRIELDDGNSSGSE